MIYFKDAVKVVKRFMNDTFEDYNEEEQGEMLEIELEQKRWLNWGADTREKLVADICEYISVENILNAIKTERLNEYVKVAKANIYGLAEMEK